MVDGVDEGVDASSQFARQSRNHGVERGQFSAVTVAGHEGDDEVWSPRKQKHAGQSDADFGYSDLVSCVGLFTASQRGHVHFLGLSSFLK